MTLLGSRSGNRSRVKRQTGGSHYVLIGFEVYIELQQNSSQTSQDMKQVNIRSCLYLRIDNNNNDYNINTAHVVSGYFTGEDF